MDLPLCDAGVDFGGRRVLVTGGTGGIGARLVERLVLDCNARVRVLVRHLNRTPRIARMPVEFATGDVISPGDTEQAVRGCEVVFHCAYGTAADPDVNRRVTVDGTRHVMEACARSGVARVVHVSTCRVFGMVTPDADLDETAPRRYSKTPYADSKLDAENIVWEFARRRGLPVSVVQPTTVYGPFVRTWTEKFLQRLRQGRPILINGGNGLCNAVYVDDVVNGMLLAAAREGAVGEAFLISGETPVTWRTYHERYGQLVGGLRAVDMTVAEAKAHYAQYVRCQRRRSLVGETWRLLKENVEVRRRVRGSWEVDRLIGVGGRLLPHAAKLRLRSRAAGGPPPVDGQSGPPDATRPAEPPIRHLTPGEAEFFAAKTRFRIDKARRLLGFQPAFDFDRGMRLTEAWARWANLIDPTGHEDPSAAKP